jgi:copper(I)-binding protein
VTRWTRRLLVGAIALMVPALAGCEAGLNAPTLQFHPAAYGATTTVDGISIDNLFVLGPAPGATLPAGGQASVFVSLYSTSSDTLTSVSAPGTASSVRLANGPVPLSPDTVADLSGPSPLITLDGLTSPLSGGESVQLVLHFATAGNVTLNVPVEPAAYQFATFSPPPTPATSASLSVSVNGHQHKARKKARADQASASPAATP